MATKPKNLDLAAESPRIANDIRENLSAEYQAAVPMALEPGTTLENGHVVTRQDAVESLRQIGATLFRYQAHQNAFLSELVNRIAMTLISSRLYRNPWARFKRGILDYGESVEELFVEIGMAHQYDPAVAEREVFKREIPDVRAAFHHLNYQKFYKNTIEEQQLRSAFLSYSGLSDLVSKIVQAMTTAANFDEKIMMKYMLAYAILNGKMGVQAITAPTLEDAKPALATMRELSLNLQDMRTDYNFAGVTTYTEPKDQIVFLSNKFSSVVDVGALAMAFNLQYADFIGNTVGINQFSFLPNELERLNNLINLDPEVDVISASQQEILDNVQAVVVDSNWFMIFDRIEEMNQKQNEEGLYWNYWLHVWKIFSTSPFANAVALTTGTNSVGTVTVTPSTMAVTSIPATGANLQLSAKVTGSGIFSQKVNWTSSNTDRVVVSASGLVTFKPYTAEQQAELVGTVVTATSAEDPTKKATFTVTAS